MIIYDADDPLVLSGVYDTEGFKPGERARIAKARARQLNGGPTKQQPRRKRTMKKNTSNRGTFASFAFVKMTDKVQVGIQAVVLAAAKKAKKGTVAEIAAVAVKLGLTKVTSQDPLTQTGVHLNRLRGKGAVKRVKLVTQPASGGAR